ncbi:MAG: response regulator transcription factor [Chryseobacterium sp.]|uniref:Response regulator n=1 Tax=Pedobacter agri TaxID=454586 RepID=A0A9X3DHM7_9SPHI|nr:response regulator [Pedobacter agri]MCX3267395.1 response regulator [Pedobacter agri]RZJ87546.1 MAG: response regulator transcription factor [Chryseobacterium sp.]
MNRSLLIIDDNKEILELLSDIFADTYTIHTAESGELAQIILDNEIIHLIISDVMMPEIDGFELCKLLKSNVNYCHIPIILLTSKNTFNAQIEGLENGADAYIQKPFSQLLLQTQVANLLQNRLKINDHFASSPFEDVRVMAHSKTDEIFLKKLDDYIRKNMKDPDLDVDQLAYHMNMSRPTFYRKIKSLSALAPKELIDVTRLKKAASLIAENQFSLYEIGNMVGYRSQSVFTKSFQRYFKLSPRDYFNSLNKEDQ